MTLAPETVEKLGKPLDPTRVKHREGFGGRSLSYLEGHDVVRTANDIFGVGEWGYHVTGLTLLGSEAVTSTRNGQTKEGFRVAYRAEVQVTVNGTAFGDTGFGDAVEYTGSKLTPHELASKEAVTDALKRCLKNLGDQFGLCLYDKFAPEHDGRNSPAGGQSVPEANGAASGTHQTASGTGTFQMPFGKHKGKTIAVIQDEDPGWLDWVLNNTDKEDIKALIREHRNLGELPEGGSFHDPTDIDGDSIPF